MTITGVDTNSIGSVQDPLGQSTDPSAAIALAAAESDVSTSPQGLPAGDFLTLAWHPIPNTSAEHVAIALHNSSGTTLEALVESRKARSRAFSEFQLARRCATHPTLI
jgi:hypothetical protein